MAPGAVEMTFAEKQLAKYGWKKGMGLGKMNDGISEPIKVKTCKNNLGIGNDPKKHLSHWWDMAYNRAVNNIIVERSENGNIEVKSSSVCSITQEKPNAFNVNVLYDDFQQAGTLKGIQFTSNNQCRAGSGSSDHEGESRRTIRGQGLLLDMTDAELLKLCGGGTAHKGARHGLRMGGKMKRLKAMEEADAARAAEKRQSQPVTANCLGSLDKKDVLADGKRKKRCSEDKEGEDNVGQENCKEAEVSKKRSKKSKKEKNKDISQIETCVGTKTDTEHEIGGEEDSTIELNSDEPTCKRMKNKRKRGDAAYINLDTHEISAELPIVSKEVKKKKRCKPKEEDDLDEENESRQTLCDSSAEFEKQKKKKKNYKSRGNLDESEENVETKLSIESRAGKADADMPLISEVDPSSEETRQKKTKRKKQMHVHHA